MSETAPTFWIRGMAETQPVWSDVKGEPFVDEADRLLMEGHKAQGLPDVKRLRLNALGRLLGWGTTAAEIEAAANARLDKLLGKFPRGG